MLLSSHTPFNIKQNKNIQLCMCIVFLYFHTIFFACIILIVYSINSMYICKKNMQKQPAICAPCIYTCLFRWKKANFVSKVIERKPLRKIVVTLSSYFSFSKRNKSGSFNKIGPTTCIFSFLAKLLKTKV